MSLVLYLNFIYLYFRVICTYLILCIFVHQFIYFYFFWCIFNDGDEEFSRHRLSTLKLCLENTFEKSSKK